ncbi:MAG: hypothetical protein OXH70_11525 [Acidobacteria bacterium]|nr:hypothetical protein [Acidobacteriota bacterium]
MRKDIVLAAVVLSVLAGLLTVGYAQNGDDTGPDAFELRRQLIDRIETSVTQDDLATLQRMNFCADLEQPAAQSDEELQSVTSAFLPWLIRLTGTGGQVGMCYSMYNSDLSRCEADRAACRARNSGGVEGAIFGLTHAGCLGAYTECTQEAFRVYNICISQPPSP